MKFFLSLALPLYVLDQITKHLILWTFPDGPTGHIGGIPVIDGFFTIVRVHNRGMAFGIGGDAAWANFIFLGIATIAVVFITVLWKKNAFPTTVSKIAVALLVSGIFGNVTDRLLHGYVVDFLDFAFGDYHWPSFNVADSCICVAAALLFITALKDPGESEEDADDPEPESDAV